VGDTCRRLCPPGFLRHTALTFCAHLALRAAPKTAARHPIATLPHCLPEPRDAPQATCAWHTAWCLGSTCTHAPPFSAMAPAAQTCHHPAHPAPAYLHTHPSTCLRLHCAPHRLPARFFLLPPATARCTHCRHTARPPHACRAAHHRCPSAPASCSCTPPHCHLHCLLLHCLHACTCLLPHTGCCCHFAHYYLHCNNTPHWHATAYTSFTYNSLQAASACALCLCCFPTTTQAHIAQTCFHHMQPQTNGNLHFYPVSAILQRLPFHHAALPHNWHLRGRAHLPPPRYLRRRLRGFPSRAFSLCCP